MSVDDGGFSFGARPPEGDDDEIDAIEVSGEPVSRSEAKNLGLANMDSSRERTATSVMRMEELPPDLPKSLAKKLEAAWGHLKKNEIEQAMTLAQEVVYEQPTLVAAKLIIARCFINRKEYDKALALLQAIPEEEKNAETWYYIGLCQSRVGKIKEAIESLKFCRAATSDTVLRKRANDLLLHLQGEQVVCPVCGKKALYDSMVDVGNQTVCANCAKNAPLGDDEDDEDYDDDVGGTRKRKRLRPPLSKSDLLIRLLFVGFICFVLSFGMYMLYILAPGYYQALRDLLPAHWEFPPHAEGFTSLPGGPGGTTTNPPPPPVAPPTLTFDSPPIDRVVAGMEVQHQIFIDGMQRRKGTYSVTFTNSTQNGYDMNKDTGLLTWLPGKEDVGKWFEIIFSARFEPTNMQARPQNNMVTVVAGPEFKRLMADPIAGKGQKVFMHAENMDADSNDELLVVAAEYWRGQLSALKASGGEYRAVSSIRIPGRPAGMGVIRAGSEKWIAIADYWNSRILYYAFREGNLVEMPMTIDLPGRPLLAAFSNDDSLVAVLHQAKDAPRVTVFKQEGQLNFRQVAEWTVSDDVVWKKLFILRNNNPDTPLLLCLLGADFGDSFMHLVQGQETVRNLRHGKSGTLVDAVLDNNGSTLHCLVADQDTLGVVSLTPGINRDDQLNLRSVPMGTSPALGGIAIADISGMNRSDMLVFKGDQVGISLADSKGGRSGATAYWPLPEPSLLFGSPAALRLSGEESSKAAVYAAANGELWGITLPIPTPPAPTAATPPARRR